MTPPADDDSSVDDDSPGDESEADDPSSNDSSGDESTTEDSPSNDPPGDTTPPDDSSVDDAPPDDSSVDDAPPDDSSVDDAPAGDSRADTQSSDASPAEDSQSGDSPAGSTPATSQQDGPAAPTDEQPSLDIEEYTTDHRSLSASVQLIWALRALVGVAIISGIVGFLLQSFDVPFSYVGIGAFGLAIVALVWVHLRHRIWTYRVREDALFLERGVVTRVNTVVPYVRIQHVDTQRSPLERALGLSTLVVYTAGSRGADVSIPGLTTHEATDLQQRVKDLAIETEGGDAL